MSQILRLPINLRGIKLQIRVKIISIMLFASTQIFGNTLKSQDIYKVQIYLELKDESLINAFKKIEAESSFYFMYREEDVKNVTNLNVPRSKQSIAAFLQLILANTPMSFKQVDQRILIIHKNSQESTNQSEGTHYAQKPLDVFEDIVVSGFVTGSNSDPLENVSVTLKGSSIATLTDEKGKYKISIPMDGVLIYSHVGFETQEVAIRNQAVINVVLRRQISTLNEVVVTALGIKREAKSLTYSTQSVPTENLTEARDPSIMNTLEGKVAGLSINSDGTGVGGANRVVLRGDRSISGDSQPLYVIDGAPIIGDISDINPDNIASINILKGPNAAALYGAGAQNGAIIIETKKGRPGAINISLNHSSQVLSPINSIQYQNEYAQGSGGVYDKTSESSWGPKMTGQIVPSWSIIPADSQKTYALTPQPNNVRDAFQNGFNTSTNLYASMGSEKIQSMFSITRTDVQGIVPGNTLGRNNFAVRLTSQLTDRLTLDTKIDLMQQVIHDPIVEDISDLNQVKQIYMMPRNIRTEDARNYSFVNAQGVIRQNFWNPGSTYGLNPYFLRNRYHDTETKQRGTAMASLSYEFSKSLKLMVRGAYDVINGGSEIETSYDFYNTALNGGYSVSKSQTSLFNSDFLLSYTKKIHKDWNFNINAGGNTQQQRQNLLNGNTNVGLLVPDFFTLSNTLFPSASYNPGPNIDIQSLYAFAHLDWKNAVFLDVTGRNDWSSTLPASHRSYFYPSVGLSAILSDLIKLPELISFAKLRASWASVGSGGPAYMLSRTATFTSGGNNGFLELSSILPNPDLRPELTNSYEFGLDAGLFKSRLNLNVTYYKTNTLNQLFTVALPPGSGASEYFTNGGNVQNKGLEILLSAVIVKTRDFRWQADLNFSRNRNLVLQINDQRPKLIIGSDQSFRDFVAIQGQPFGQVYSIGFLRDANGNVIVDDRGVPLNTGSRSVSVANANPDWMGGITNSFSYKNFNLSFLIDVREGGTVLSVTKAVMANAGVTKETQAGREGGLVFGKNLFPNQRAVTQDGKPNDIAVDPETFWTSMGGFVNPVGEAFGENMSNVRVREVIFGYTFPRSLLGNLPVSQVRLSLVGRNLFFIYRASHDLDPDISIGTSPLGEGQTSFAPPSTRSYGLNLKIDFK